MATYNDLTGQKIGCNTVLYRVDKGTKTIWWMCRCDCGYTRAATHVKDEVHSHCIKCFIRPPLPPGGHITHGHSKGKKHSPTYSSWSAMKKRCTDKNNNVYKNYGGRGISFYVEWLDFTKFLSDMGIKPPGTSLDRIDNDGNYCKENCKWSTKVEQVNNRRNNIIIEMQGERLTLTQAVAKYSPLSYMLVRTRIQGLGWDINDAFFTPPYGKKHPSLKK